MLKSLSYCFTAISLYVLGASQSACQPKQNQPQLGVRIGRPLEVDELEFRDLNHNGRLEPYEDWRLSPEIRTDDLLGRLSLDDMAGLLTHGTLQAHDSSDPMPGGESYNFVKAQQWIVGRHVSSFVTRLNGTAVEMAVQNNRIQEIAESSSFGIPVLISSDPKRHYVHQMLGARERDRAFSLWPEPLGFAAIGDPQVERQFADTVRREYMAVGIRESLAPQADLATEPRWSRVQGTFGEDASVASSMVEAYVTGVQGGGKELGGDSVVAVVKHWVGYGAAKDGWDSHNFYGRFASFKDGNFAYHLEPYQGAFRAHVGGVMPAYSVMEDVTVLGVPLERVGVGYSQQLLNELLRREYAFKGVVLSDWLITNDCETRCREGAPIGEKSSLKESGMPWGVENLSVSERFAKAINAGVDQIGGTEDPSFIIDDVHRGLITMTRVAEAARRVLLQRFELGLFEQPYVDELAAAKIARNPEFVRAGQVAQMKAVVLLENKPEGNSGRPLLPFKAAGRKVYLYGISPAAAVVAGFNVVSDPSKADVAIVRAPPPHSIEHPNFYFGSREHEGRLNFVATDPAYAELLRVSLITPTIFVTTLERALILTNVKPYASALLGDFGLEDSSLMALISGEVAPEGRLPIELPSSLEAVRNQASDRPHDSAAPLYAFGFGLRYAPSTSPRTGK